ncbi:hypothetical protein [Microbacterium hatanonis]|uniref:Uncharacterized protein n=1 Tax=Microbacterium hatanonis TaxID=404366 RepID=A0A5C8I0Z7_9MICO|nr:hypothetical protein [Microbacterium hatanonis]TXK12652.1 hypothetical protein FVP77_04105 [Microbacterium hatanonis]
MHARLRSVGLWTLIALALFQALTAIVGGIVILATDGMGMPGSFLVDGPFRSFVWPGLILLVVVGGTQAVAATLLLMRRESGLLWSAVAGFGMLIWIFVETGVIRGTSWLQFLYFTTGTVQLVLVLALLGVVGWLPRRDLVDAGRARDGAMHDADR